MIRQLSDGTWEFDSVEEAVQFFALRESDVTKPEPSDEPSGSRDTNGSPESVSPPRPRRIKHRLKPSEVAAVSTPEELLDKSGLRDKDAHNFIYQTMLNTLQTGDDPWFTNKRLVKAAAWGGPNVINSIDISHGLAYLLMLNLIEEHPEDILKRRGNRYKIMEEIQQ